MHGPGIMRYLRRFQNRHRGSLSPLEGRKFQTGAPSSVDPTHLSPVPDWLGMIARPMMCRDWAPGARQPGRTAVRPPDMTLNGTLLDAFSFRRGQGLYPWMVGLLSLNGEQHGESHTSDSRLIGDRGDNAESSYTLARGYCPSVTRLANQPIVPPSCLHQFGWAVGL